METLVSAAIFLIKTYALISCAFALYLIVHAVIHFDRFDLRQGLPESMLMLLTATLLWPILLWIRDTREQLLKRPLSFLRSASNLATRDREIYQLNRNLRFSPMHIELDIGMLGDSCLARISAHDANEYFRHQLRGRPTNGKSQTELAYNWTANIDTLLPPDTEIPQIICWQMHYSGQALALQSKADLYCKKCATWHKSNSLKIITKANTRSAGSELDYLERSRITCPIGHIVFSDMSPQTFTTYVSSRKVNYRTEQQNLQEITLDGKQIVDLSSFLPEGIDTRKQLTGFAKELWELVIEPMAANEFSLPEVYRAIGPLKERLQNHRDPDATVRANLQKLRDRGYIEFVDNNGRYRKVRHPTG